MMDYATALENMPDKDADDTGIWKQDYYETIRSALELAMKVESGELVMCKKFETVLTPDLGDGMGGTSMVQYVPIQADTKGTRG